MAINSGRNKPIGPGGSTRRLHHFPHTVLRATMGAKQDRRGCKGFAFARHGTTASDQHDSCKWQLCWRCCSRRV